ncbi:MAG: Ig-like domain-containing protein [Myxococcales bacterium]
MSASPTSLTVGNSTTITVTVRDANDNVISGQAVSLAVSGTTNTLTPASGTTNGSGQFVATLSSTRAEGKTITATVGSFSVTTSVTFNPGPVSATQSSVGVSPASVPANNSTSSTITITVRDAFGNPRANETVTLSITGTATVTQPSAATNSSGVTTGSIRSGTVNTVTITATVTGFGALADRPTVTFVPALKTFTNCNQTGRLGPTQAMCNSAYTGTSLAGEVTVDGSGIQRWTVPTSGTYRIEVWGAQGVSGMSGREGGYGARMRGDFNLTAGQVLKVLVGQMGTAVVPGSGGGGGGSFVTLADNTPLIIAGGGAGTRDQVQQNGCHGRISQEGGTASGSAETHDCGQKVGSIRQGGIMSSSSWGSGGGGMDSGGGADGSWGTGGASYIAGAAGGEGFSCTIAPGGFGGGGAGNGCWGGGGGGGYSGGDGGRLAGGGGSFNNGSNQSNTAGVRLGHGQIVIQAL